MKRSEIPKRFEIYLLIATVTMAWLWLMEPSMAYSLEPLSIPEGKFQMGTRDGTEEERPAHKVWLNAFTIDDTEVTNRDYEKYRPNHRRSLLSACDDCPVTLVNWYEADTYCKEHRGGRLPTEAEWEKTARGPEGWNYAFGPNPDPEKGHFGKPFKAGTAEVISSQAKGYGAHHMSGNVWEWTANWFGPYPSGEVRNPKGPARGFQKIVRGGSWYNPAYYIHVGRRFKLAPNVALNSVGFRCAYDIQEK